MFKKKINKWIMLRIVALVGALLFMGGMIWYMLYGNDISSNSDGKNIDNGYRTNCFTDENGQRCCVTCKKTSYGDVGCATVCND